MGQIISNGNATDAIAPSRLVRKVLGSMIVAQLCGISESAVRKWDRRMPNGTGGLIPTRYQHRLLVYARANNKPLTADDLIAEAVE